MLSLDTHNNFGLFFAKPPGNTITGNRFRELNSKIYNALPKRTTYLPHDRAMTFLSIDFYLLLHFIRLSAGIRNQTSSLQTARDKIIQHLREQSCLRGKSSSARVKGGHDKRCELIFPLSRLRRVREQSRRYVTVFEMSIIGMQGARAASWLIELLFCISNLTSHRYER